MKDQTQSNQRKDEPQSADDSVLDEQFIDQKSILNLFQLKPNIPKKFRLYVKQIYEYAIFTLYYRLLSPKTMYEQRQGIQQTNDRRHVKNMFTKKRIYYDNLLFSIQSQKVASKALQFNKINPQDDLQVVIKGFCFTTTNEMNELLFFYQQFSNWSLKRDFLMGPSKIFFLQHDNSEQIKEIKSFMFRFVKILEIIRQEQVEYVGPYLLQQVELFKPKLITYIEKKNQQLIDLIEKVREQTFQFDHNLFLKVLPLIQRWNLAWLDRDHLQLGFTIPPESIIHIAFPNLVELVLDNDNIKSVEFIKFLNSPNLVKVYLQYNQITILKSFGSCISRQIQCLKLSGNIFSYHEMKALSRLNIKIQLVYRKYLESHLQFSYESGLHNKEKMENFQKSNSDQQQKSKKIFMLSFSSNMYPAKQLTQVIPRLPRMYHNQMLVNVKRQICPVTVDLRPIRRGEDFSKNKMQEQLVKKATWNLRYV